MADVAPTTDPELTGFTYIRRKGRNTRQKKGNNGKPVFIKHEINREVTTSHLQEKFDARQAILQSSGFLRDFKESLNAIVADVTFPTPTGLKMMGIGTLTHNPSMTQLCFGLELAKLLSLDVKTVRTSDPMFTAIDTEFLTSLGITVETVKAGDVHDVHKQTLIFAPHVPKSVYESTLRQYWHDMDNLVLIGNNLRHYPDIYSDAKLRAESPAILALARGSQLEVVPLPSNFEYNNVFNDLAIMWIKPDAVLPEIDFSFSTIEKEKFEINQDDLASLTANVKSLDLDATDT